MGRWPIKPLVFAGAEGPICYEHRRPSERTGHSCPGGADGADLYCRLVNRGCPPVLGALWTGGKAWSVDLLGEATISDQEADRYRDRCVAALDQLAQAARAWLAHPLLEKDHLGAVPRCSSHSRFLHFLPFSIRLIPRAALRSVAARLRPIVDAAMRSPASLIFDMEQADTKSLMIEIFTRLFSETPYRQFPHAGLALQAYHRETTQDVASLLGWARTRGAPITIRLVKGAYWDSGHDSLPPAGWPVPLFEEKAETDFNYESLVRILLEASSLIRPAFGTHNLRTLAYVEAVAEHLGLPPPRGSTR